MKKSFGARSWSPAEVGGVMQFEWDDAKRLANLEKHGIDFADIADVWAGDLINPAGNRIVQDEFRVLALGSIGDDSMVVAVVYTVRGEIIRLISARRASKDERQIFRSRFGYGQ